MKGRYWRPRTATEETNRSLGGALAKRRGLWFEQELEQSNAQYLALGQAVIERVHPPVAGAPGAMRMTGKGPVDFIGVLRGGRAIVFDAKTRADPSSFAYDARDQHQIKALVAAANCGALAFVLIADSTRGVAYIVGGAHLQTLRSGGRVQLRESPKTGSKPLVPVVVKQELMTLIAWDYLAAMPRKHPTPLP